MKMPRPVVLHHKKGCVWYEMKIERIDRQIRSLNERKKMIVDMMNIHHQKEIEWQKKRNQRNSDLKRRFGRIIDELGDKKGT